MKEKISPRKLKQGNICKLMKSNRTVKCFDKKGNLIGIHIVKKSERRTNR